MHLPEHVAGEYSIAHDKDTVYVTMELYYACDGTIQTVETVGDTYVKLKDHSDGTVWTVGYSDLLENLFRDFFPLSKD